MLIKRNIKNLILSIIIISYIFIYKFFIFSNYMKISEYINASFLIIFLGISIKLLGIRKDKINYINSNIIKIVMVYLAIAFLLMYGAGIYVGYLKNSYSLELITIFDNIFAPLVIIVVTELIRYVVIWANKDKKLFLVLFTLILSILEIIFNTNTLNIDNLSDLFRLSATIIIPIVIKNSVLSYICYYAGIRVPIIYRIIMELYVYIVPVVPNLGEYLTSMVYIALPLILYIGVFPILEERERKSEPIFKKDSFSIVDIPIFMFVIICVCLISGFFPHYMIGIGSDSMKPHINKGDAVILKKVNSNTRLKKGDIIAYKSGKITVVHRIVDVKDNKYVTKGDANNVNDSKKVNKKQIEGIVRVRIPYIAYPTVWFSELVNNN